MQRNLLCLVVAPRSLTRRVLQLWNLGCCLSSVLDGFFPLLSGLVSILQMFYRTAPAPTVFFSAAMKLEATMCRTIGVASRVWGASVGPPHWGYPHSETCIFVDIWQRWKWLEDLFCSHFRCCSGRLWRQIHPFPSNADLQGSSCTPLPEHLQWHLSKLQVKSSSLALNSWLWN